MALQFVLGGSGSGKSYYVYSEIIRRAADGRDYLVIVPDQFTMQTQKELCTMKENTREGIMNIDVLSFSRLSHRITEEVGQVEGLLLDDTGKNLILRKVAFDKEQELSVLGRYLSKIGYIHEVKSMISEFYQYDIGETELLDLIAYAENRGMLSHKLNDLKVLKDAFASYIEGKYITTEESLERLCRLLPESDIIKNSVIVLDGFTGFTPVQNKLVREMMRLSDEMIVTLVADGITDVDETNRGKEEKLFYLSNHTYDTLRRIALEEGIEKKEDIVLPYHMYDGDKYVIRYQNNPELGFLEKNLFRGNAVYPEMPQNLAMFEARGPKEEIQGVLLKIKELIREGYSYRDIAVITGSTERYVHLMEMEAPKYQVPVFMDQKKGILFHPMAEFLRAAMEVVLYDFNRESVLRFLRTGLTGLSREETDQLDLYITRFGMRGRKRYEKLFTKKGDYSVEALAQINTSRQKVMDLLGRMSFAANGAAYEADKLVEAVYDMCVEAKLQEQMEQYRQYFEALNELARAKEYEQVYRAVVDLFDTIHTLLAGEKITLREFSQILEAGLSEISIGTIPQNVDQVVVGDIQRTRLKQIKALFFVGVNDGVIPSAGKGGGLLSEMEREFLLGAGHELAPTPKQQLYIQRLYLYLNMTKPSDKLYLSYSRVDNEGKSLRKSYLIATMRKMFPKLKVEQALPSDVLNVATMQDGLDDLAQLFNLYAAGLLEENREKKEQFFALLKAFEAEDREGLVSFLTEASFYAAPQKELPMELARALYGDIVESSVGRLEQFSACAYAHFLRYGLKLKEQSEFELEASDIGNMFHEVMKLFSEYLKERGEHWGTFDITEADRFVERTMEKLAKEYESALFYDSASNRYAVEDMKKVLKRTIKTLRFQLSRGLFEPRSFEVPFYVGDKIKARGRIDRIDTFEKDGNVYVKVVDYKSGSHKFDPVELYFGLNMQLSVYMNAAVTLEKQRKQNADKDIIPAALVYYQFQNPYVDLENEGYKEELAEEKILEKMQISGLVSERDTVLHAMDQEFETASAVMPVKRKKDGSLSSTSITGTTEQFSLLMEYADYKIKEIGERVYKGDISVNPYQKDDRNACTYCSYKGVCHFDTKVEGFVMRKLDKMSADEAWDKMSECLGRKEVKAQLQGSKEQHGGTSESQEGETNGN